MTERTRTFINDKDMAKPFFYARWYKCPKCRWQLMREEDKIYNNTTVRAKTKFVNNLLKDDDETPDFLKHLKSI